jgi:hypothetical protein
MDDDDFWITHIATTPEEDADFAGLGCRNNSVALFFAILIGIAALFLFRR